MEASDIAIVGCGPAGAVLALLLARSGVRVTVLEQGAGFEREFRGEALQAGTQRIFSDLGLGERLRALDHGAPRGARLDLNGKRSQFAFSADGALAVAAVIFVPQPRLLELVVAAARERPEFSLVMGAHFKDLVRDGDRVAGVRYATHDGTVHELRARCVIACDGRFSAVRRAAGLTLHDFFMPYDLVWFATDGHAENEVYARVNGHDLFFGFPSRAQNMQIGWLIEKGTFPSLKARGFAELKRSIVERVPVELAALAERSLHDPAQLALLPAVSQLAERWWLPGLLLLGDAAHPSSPVGGQGINLAIQDAVVAARLLAQPALRGDVPGEVLAAIAAERLPAIRRVQRQQNLFPTLLHAIGPARVLSLMRVLVAFFANTGLRPRFVQRALDRFMWGDPPVRADEGPWVSGRSP